MSNRGLLGNSVTVSFCKCTRGGLITLVSSLLNKVKPNQMMCGALLPDVSLHGPDSLLACRAISHLLFKVQFTREVMFK